MQKTRNSILNPLRLWGSEVYTACGLNPRMDIGQLINKIKTRKEFDREKYRGENEKNGVKFEKVALGYLLNLIGKDKFFFEEPRVFYPDDNPELSCAKPDGLLFSKGNSKKLEAVIEIKIPAGEMYQTPPLKYIVQVLYQIHCSKSDFGYFFAAKVDPDTEMIDESVKPMWYAIYPTEESIEWILERIRYFQECILRFGDEEDEIFPDTDWVRNEGSMPMPLMYDMNEQDDMLDE